MFDAREIEALLSPGYERRGFEVKGAGPRTDKHLFAKVTRAALGMGNLRDGGYVIIGIDDTNLAAMLPGLAQAELDSWSYDDVARKLDEYADPPLGFDLAARVLSSGATVAVMQVYEFADMPHICKKDYQGVLRAGALYVRPRRVPETSEVPSSVEMRDVLDLATEKELRKFYAKAGRAGLTLSPATPQPTDEERFEAQEGEGWK